MDVAVAAAIAAAVAAIAAAMVIAIAVHTGGTVVRARPIHPTEPGRWIGVL